MIFKFWGNKIESKETRKYSPEKHAFWTVNETRGIGRRTVKIMGISAIGVAIGFFPATISIGTALVISGTYTLLNRIAEKLAEARREAGETV